MANRPWLSWMKVFLGDYLKSTTKLSTTQHGAYWLLILYAWQKEGYIPDCDKELATITRLSITDLRAIKDKLLKLFDIDEAKRYCLIDMITELELARQRYERKPTGGRKGANARWQAENHD